MPQLTSEALDKLKGWEALGGEPVLEAYPDPGSRDGAPWTIGYGTTRIDGKPVQPGTTITAEQAEEYLRKDLAWAEAAVRELVKVPLADNQYGALVSFVYNVGRDQFAGSTLLRKLNAGQYDAVPSELAKWKYNDGKVRNGLINRRAAEAGLWARGSHVAGRDVPAAPVKAPPPVMRPEVIGPVVAGSGTMLAAMVDLPVILQVAVGICVVMLAGAATYLLIRKTREAT